MRFTRDLAEWVMVYLLSITMGAVVAVAVMLPQVWIAVLLLAPPWVVCMYQFLFGFEKERAIRRAKP